MNDNARTKWKRGEVIWAVGAVTDRIIRDLRELQRRERILDAFQRAQEVSEGDVGTAKTAPEIRGNPRRTTNDGPTGESAISGKLNR